MPDNHIIELAAVREQEDKRPVVRLSADKIHMAASEAEDALISADAPFFIRGDILVRPVVDDLPAARGLRTKVPRVKEVTTPYMRDWLSRAARFERYDDRRKAYVAKAVPKELADIILSRDGEWRFPQLAGVIATPTIRPDGSILSEAGYDPETRLLLASSVTLPAIPETPSKEDAIAALATLSGLLAEFPFDSEPSKSVALSALISPVARAALFTVPLHAVTAPTAGSGKSFLVDIAAGMAIGQFCPVISVGADETEMEKRLGAAAMKGGALISIDNANKTIGGDFLCQLIERPLIEPRELGLSRLVRVENRACLFATGNNLAFRADATRRVLISRLDPEMERPELRVFNKDPMIEVIVNRGRYIAAALTIVRAYAAAGFPDELPAIGSFGDWSRFVRSALVWLGCADPAESMEQARNDDPDAQELRDVIEAWDDALGPNFPVKTGRLIEIANEREGQMGEGALRNPNLFEALETVAKGRHGIDSRTLGLYFKRHVDRVVGGLRISRQQDTDAKQARWVLRKA